VGRDKGLKACTFIVLATVSLFLSCLIASTPHQVHHAFDPNPENSCIAFALSKGCDLKLADAISLSVIQVVIEQTTLSSQVWIPFLTISLFLPRAPPIL
jgi:hypothetical protein